MEIQETLVGVSKEMDKIIDSLKKISDALWRVELSSIDNADGN
jgi:hypothetical protein